MTGFWSIWTIVSGWDGEADPTSPISPHFCYHISMKRLLPVLMVLGVFLGSAGECFALSKCPSYKYQRYHNCFGTYSNAKGDMYVGLQPVPVEGRAPSRLSLGSRRELGVLSS